MIYHQKLHVVRMIVSRMVVYDISFTNAIAKLIFIKKQRKSRVKMIFL